MLRIICKLFFDNQMKDKIMSRFTETLFTFQKVKPQFCQNLASILYLFNTYFASNILSEYSATTASSHNRYSTGSESQNLSILSPFDEQEEWHKISEILNSFGTNLGSSVKESTTPNNCKYKALEIDINRLDIFAYLNLASNPGSYPQRLSDKNCKS